MGIAKGGIITQQTCQRENLAQQWRELTGSGHVRGNYHQWTNRDRNECLGLASTTDYGQLKAASCASNHLQQFWALQRA
jgi:hypothetical protein